jgi:hypothetical protein
VLSRVAASNGAVQVGMAGQQSHQSMQPAERDLTTSQVADLDSH